MTTMRIAESYFQGLLHETPPFDAVHELAGIWQPRASEGAPDFGLSWPEHNVQMVLSYTGELGNGGHVQFFSNRGGHIVARVEAGVRSASRILVRFSLAAVAFFPGQAVPAKPEDVERLFETWTEADFDRFQVLDRRLWAVRNVEEHLLQYLRVQERDVLRSERGLC